MQGRRGEDDVLRGTLFVEPEGTSPLVFNPPP